MIEVYIALGSNLDSPYTQVTTAIQACHHFPQTDFICASSLYASKPLGPQNQADFVNAVVKLKTHLSPQALLAACLQLEQAHGRVRRVRWGPRTLDCDVLLYGNEQIHEEGLTIPHPEMTQRAFVVVPLLEIAPDCVVQGKALQSYLLQLDAASLKKINSLEDMKIIC